MLRWKPEVRVGVWTPALTVLCEIACEWSLLHRVDVRVNSFNDGPGVHMAGSLHYADLAGDFDPDSDAPADRLSLAEYFRVRLPAGYDVIWEGTHVHVECDAHRPALPALPNV